jgi:hypothetical protein
MNYAFPDELIVFDPENTSVKYHESRRDVARKGNTAYLIK